jgi:FRG domain
MLTQQHFEKWTDLEAHVRALADANSTASTGQIGHFSDLLFRGQASHGWSLETTLERAQPELSVLAEYYRVVAVAKTQIETFTNRSWTEIDYTAIASSLSSYDALRLASLPAYDFLIYLRHHGFPSPLLDWTRSLYVAAFFAFHAPKADRVALFVYQEQAGSGKYSSSAFPQILALGPNVRSHPRHFLQQGEYTMCTQFDGGTWCLRSHSSVFGKGQDHQDLLWKFTVPSSEAPTVMRHLNEYNINAFSLFQTEEALLETLARQLLARSLG